MSILRRLWLDEAGFVLSAETALIGTLGIGAATVGLTAAADSIHNELADVALAIRSLDQSFVVPEVRIGNAWTAGSAFKQRPVAESIAELKLQIEKARHEEKKREKLEAPAAGGDRSRPST